MDLGITGRIALVTGGSHGIGRAISLDLARNGCRVVVVARKQQWLDETLKAIRDEGGEAIAVSADLLDLSSYPRMVAETEAAFGQSPDIAIYSPVGPPPGAFDDFGDEDFDRSYHAVVKGFANFVRAVAPGMKARRWGRIVTIGSGHGKLPARLSTLHFSYVLANTNRPAALGLSRTIADELGPYGITVNTIPPGFIDTGENYKAFFEVCAAREGLSYEQFMERELKRIPMNRYGKPEEISGVCAFLCSERAAYITGQYIVVDGGHMETYF